MPVPTGTSAKLCRVPAWRAQSCLTGVVLGTEFIGLMWQPATSNSKIGFSLDVRTIGQSHGVEWARATQDAMEPGGFSGSQALQQHNGSWGGLQTLLSLKLISL